jgi:ribosomal protein L40E
MQAHVHKKERESTVVCPKCHAVNLATQKSCGRCGYIFPIKGPKKGQKLDADFGAINYSANMGGQEVEMGEEEEPKIPRHMAEKEKSEGHISSRKEWLKCPRCGADVGMDAKRCLKCGHKFGKK